jgi:hypothetical protein
MRHYLSGLTDRIIGSTAKDWPSGWPMRPAFGGTVGEFVVAHGDSFSISVLPEARKTANTHAQFARNPGPGHYVH